MPKPKNDSQPLPDAAAIQKMLDRMMGGLEEEGRSAERKAQDLVYDAMDAPTAEKRMRLVGQALKLDPGNVDAQLMMAEAAECDPAERVDIFRKAVAAGAQLLGKKAFQELVPHFWGFIETRPYMRARLALAMALCDAGRSDEAVKEFQEMLALNENDNQGVRYELLPLLLTLGRLKEAGALMKLYKETRFNVVFAWGRVLERLLLGREEAAAKELAGARKQNPHVEIYLKGHRKPPKHVPGSYSPGSKEEALCYAEVLATAWLAHPEAWQWLLRQAGPTVSRRAG